MNSLGYLISGIALIFTSLTYFRNGHRDSRKDVQDLDLRFESLKESLINLNAKLDQVGRDTSETRADIKSLNKDLANMDRRISLVERDLQTAFIRIDELKGEIHK